MTVRSSLANWTVAAFERSRQSTTPTRLVGVAFLLGLVSFVFAGLSAQHYRSERGDARTSAERAAIESATSAAGELDLRLESMAAVVDELAGRMSEGELADGLADRVRTFNDDPESRFNPTACRNIVSALESGGPDASNRLGIIDFERELCISAAGIPELNGIGVVFADSVDPDTRYRPYANRIGGTLDLGELSPRGPEPDDWYENAVDAGGGVWTHPRIGRTSNKPLAFYSAPFATADGSVQGVLLATYALDQLAADLRLLSLGRTGYSIVLSDQARLVSHPNLDRVARDVRLDRSSREFGTVLVLRDALAESGDDDALKTGFSDDVTGADAWLAHASIPSAGWTFGAVVLEREVLGRTIGQSRSLINAGVLVLVGLLMFAVGVLRSEPGNERRWWALSNAAATFATVGIALVWFVVLTTPPNITPNDEPTGANDDVAEVVDADAGSTEIRATSSQTSTTPANGDDGSGDAEPIFAGVFVQSVEFTGSNDVNVSGIIWQKQRNDERRTEPPGFVFPEADEVVIEEQYRETNGNVTRVGWSFTVNLRQTFDYTRYPLDREAVWLRLWPSDYDAPFVMLPDLTSYETLAPSTNPGIEQNFVIEGWELEGSSFSYVDNDYNTNFGPRNVAGESTLELYFNVLLKRSFLDALMSQLVPLLVVAILLFSVLVITKRKEGVDTAIDFSALGVLGYCAALFFVVILSHTELRSNLKAEEVMYLEYFYFAAYIAILIVSANAILVGTGRGGAIIHYRDNLIPSLLFWPLLNGALFVVTLFAFY